MIFYPGLQVVHGGLLVILTHIMAFCSPSIPKTPDLVIDHLGLGGSNLESWMVRNSPETNVVHPATVTQSNKLITLEETLVYYHPEVTPTQVQYFAEYATEEMKKKEGNRYTRIWEPEEVEQLYQEWKVSKKRWIFHLHYSWDKLLEKMKQIFKRTPESNSSNAKTA